MSTVIFILILVSLYHFIVEVLLLPILRFNVTCKLSSQRDKLFLLRLKYKSDINHKTFSALNLYICTIANNQEKFNLFSLLFSKKAKSQSLNKATEEFVEVLESLEKHKIVELNEIFQTSSKLGVKAILNNSIGWAIYIFPLLLVLIILVLILSIFSKHVLDIYHNLAGRKQEKMITIAAENRYNATFESSQPHLRNWLGKSNDQKTLAAH